MAKILWNENVSLANLPEVKPVHDIYRAFLIQGFSQLIADCNELASFEGGSIIDTWVPQAVLLADFADLLQLTDDQKREFLGADVVSWLKKEGLE